MDIFSFCELFYASHYIPIALYEGSKFISSSGFFNDKDPYPFVFQQLYSSNSPCLYVSSDSGSYGMIKDSDGIHSIVLGPVYSTNITERAVYAFMRKNAIPSNKKEEITSFLSGIPKYTYNQFLNLLLYIHFSFTGEKISISEAFGITDTEIQETISRNNSKRTFSDMEEGANHGTYVFEQNMLELIKNGEVEKLEELFMEASRRPISKEGKLAENPLRQAKNIFIGWTTIVGKFAAIPGGMEIEQTYRLIDTYIQECEKLNSVDAVKNLQYVMSKDFVQRVAQQKIPKGVSKAVYSSIEYISNHINEPISIDEIVEVSGKSRAYIFRSFQSELGMTIGKYIIECRLREAKSLLKYTDKSLTEISNYLCFSSQSHFQNLFKKHYGITPLKYRKMNISI